MTTGRTAQNGSRGKRYRFPPPGPRPRQRPPAGHSRIPPSTPPIGVMPRCSCRSAWP